MCCHHIPMAECKRYLIEGIDTIDNSGSRSHCYEGIHVWRKMEKTLKAPCEDFSVYYSNRYYKYEKSQSENHRILCAKKNRRQWPAHHVPHRYVKERKREDDGQQKTLLHFQILFSGYIASRLCFCSFCCLFYGDCPITCFLNSRDDSVLSQSILVIFNFHIVLEKIDTDVPDAFKPGNTFLYSDLTRRTTHSRDIKTFFHIISIPHPCGVYIQYNHPQRFLQGMIFISCHR